MHTKVVTMYEIAMLKNIGGFMNVLDTRVVTCKILSDVYLSKLIEKVNEFVEYKNIKTIETLANTHGNNLNAIIVYYYE